MLPGAVDPHTHLKMPFGGTWSIDDYDTGTQAAAAGGTTSIVDFALQMHPDGLVASLAEWQGRAAGTAHVDYGFHMAITNATAPTIADMGAMIDAGVTTFKVFLAYRGVLMVTDDQFLRVLQESKATGGLVMVHAENGDAIDLLVHQALAAGRTEPKVHAETRPEIFEAEATSRAVRIAEYAGTPIYIVHVTCQGAAEEIIAGRARGVDAMGETCIQYLTLDVVRSLAARSGWLRGRPLRLLAAAARPAQPAVPVGRDHGTTTCRCCRPTTARSTTSRRPSGCGDFSKIPNGLALIQHRVNLLWEHGVREGRLTPSRAVELLSTAPARIFGLTNKGALEPGKDADIAILDPEREHVFSPRDVADGGRLRPVRGPPDARQRAHHARARHDGLGRRQDPHAARPRPVRGPRDLRRNLMPFDPARAIADLRAIAELTGGHGTGGARRVCWTDEWLKARAYVREQLEATGAEIDRDEAGNVWAYLRGPGDGMVIVGSHVDSVPEGGWLDGVLGIAGALEVLRATAEAGTPPCTVAFVDFADEEGARFTRSLFGSSAVSGYLVPAELADLRDRDGNRLEDVLREYGVEISGVLAAGNRLDGARAYLELHIEQGPVLEAEGLAVGTVLGTVGIERFRVHFIGPGRARRVDADPPAAGLVPGRRPHRARAAGDRAAPRRRLHRRQRRLHAGRRHGRPRPHRDPGRPAPPATPTCWPR